jgi:hypothetical protein
LWPNYNFEDTQRISNTEIVEVSGRKPKGTEQIIKTIIQENIPEIETWNDREGVHCHRSTISTSIYVCVYIYIYMIYLKLLNLEENKNNPLSTINKKQVTYKRYKIR